MVCIAISGGLASGKSTLACTLVNRYNIPVLDADDVVRQLYRQDKQVIQAFVKYFGTSILHPQGGIDSVYLARLLFTSTEHRNFVQSCVHPLVRARLMAFKKRYDNAYAFCVVPLLYETQTVKIYDATLIIDCSVKQQQDRALSRGMDPSLVKNIMFHQSSRLERLSIADDVIFNTRDKAFLYRQIPMLLLKHRRRGIITTKMFGEF